MESFSVLLTKATVTDLANILHILQLSKLWQCVMSQCFVQWRVPILVWYVQIRPFPYQQLQKDILQISTVLRVGSTAAVSSSSTEQSARVFWEVLLCCWVSSSRHTAGSQTAWSWDEGVMILNNVRTTHWKPQHHILQQCHCNYFKYPTVLSVTKSLNFWWQTVPFEHGLWSHRSVLYTVLSSQKHVQLKMYRITLCFIRGWKMVCHSKIV